MPLLAALLISLFTLGMSACRDQAPASVETTPPPARQAEAKEPPASPSHQRDLSIDESMGGHTLSRHVGKSDAELQDRLKRERQISAASTYTDRATAERAVGKALASHGDELKAWQNRRGRRPNLVLRYVAQDQQSIGRSLSRGRRTPVPCTHALVVLRWDERADRFYVLTSYPEAER